MVRDSAFIFHKCTPYGKTSLSLSLSLSIYVCVCVCVCVCVYGQGPLSRLSSNMKVTYFKKFSGALVFHNYSLLLLFA